MMIYLILPAYYEYKRKNVHIIVTIVRYNLSKDRTKVLEMAMIFIRIYVVYTTSSSIAW